MGRTLDEGAQQPRLASDGAPLYGDESANSEYDGPPPEPPAYGDSPGTADRGVSARGWIQPVYAPIVSGFRTRERPDHDGVDLGAPRHTPIVAAASGIVIRARCNAIDTRDGSDWGCHRDGDPSLTKGCGWYVDILHSGQAITRYCHMVSEPLVEVGDLVFAGQPLGQVGSTGYSSGPHLHYEVHVDADSASGGAIDPEPWMRDRGAPLGQPGLL
jgi:murein DD-endopeptidase MepM/ murein hydrolase activator NlpD